MFDLLLVVGRSEFDRKTVVYNIYIRTYYYYTQKAIFSFSRNLAVINYCFLYRSLRWVFYFYIFIFSFINHSFPSPLSPNKTVIGEEITHTHTYIYIQYIVGKPLDVHTDYFAPCLIVDTEQSRKDLCSRTTTNSYNY